MEISAPSMQKSDDKFQKIKAIDQSNHSCASLEQLKFLECLDCFVSPQDS